MAGAALVVVSLALRLGGLTSHGLYRDDAWPALAVKTGIGRAIRLGVTTPGFELLLRAWLRPDPGTVRAQLPALAASVVAVALVYWLARSVGCRRAAAFAAGAVMALAPVNIVYATRVKPYAFDAVSTTLVLAAALAVRRRPDRWRSWAVLVVVAVAGALVSASVLPVGLVALAWCAVPPLAAGTPAAAARRPAVTAVTAYVVFGLVYAVVVLGTVPPPLHDSWAANFVDLSSPLRALSTAGELLEGFSSGIFYLHGPLAVAVLLGLLAGAVWARRDLAGLVVGPVALALVLAALQRVPFGGGRIDSYLYPCVALALGLAVDRVAHALSITGRGSLLLEGAVGVGVLLVALTLGRSHLERHPYPAADVARLDAAIRARMAPGDAIVVAPFGRYPYALSSARAGIVLSRRYSTGFTVASNEPDVLVMPAEFYEQGYEAEVAVRFAASRARVWYLATDTPASDTPPDAQRHEYEPERLIVDSGFTLVDRLPAYGAHADLLVRG